MVNPVAYVPGTWPTMVPAVVNRLDLALTEEFFQSLGSKAHATKAVAEGCLIFAASSLAVAAGADAGMPGETIEAMVEAARRAMRAAYLEIHGHPGAR